jgi:PIN domain nuclease of toxin-antitoxin system
MKLLLDTHIWLWSVLEPHRLSPRVAGELTNPEHQLWLSAVSVWELQMLVHKKRLQLHEEVGAWVAKTLNMLQLNEAPLTIEVALAIPAVSLGHGDPADQILAASAKVFGLTLVTADERLIKSKQIATMPNR